MSPKSNVSYFKREEEKRNVEEIMGAEAENEVMCPQTKAHQGLPVVTGSWERDMEQILPQEPPEGNNPAAILISEFWPPELGEKEFLLF